MASVTITYAAGTEAGAELRRLGHQIVKLAGNVPDRVSSGASTVLTIDNVAKTVQITAGPYAGSALYFSNT